MRFATSPNSLACASAFCPVVPSSTIKFSLWALGNSRSMMRFIFLSSSIRFFLLWRRPAVSQISTSTFLAFAALTASKITEAGSAPSVPPIMSTPARCAHSANWSPAAALKVSAAAISTFLPCFFKIPASFPTEVVLPTPLTPMINMTDCSFSKSYAVSPTRICSLMLSTSSSLHSDGCRRCFFFTSSFMRSIISLVALTPISPIIRISSNSS